VDQQAQAGIGRKRPQEADIVAEKLVVEKPAFQLGDGGGFGFFVRPVNDEQAEKVRPSGFEHEF